MNSTEFVTGEPQIAPCPCADKSAEASVDTESIPPSSEPFSFSINPKSDEFRRTFFPNATSVQWNDWKWQLQNAFSSAQSIEKVMPLSDDEKKAISLLKQNGRLPIKISPYYLSLFYDSEPGSPLRKTMIPILDELEESESEKSDPLDESGSSPVPGIVHRYPDRALFTVTNMCTAYCRYCTRSHFVERLGNLPQKQWDKAIDYLRRHEEIRDVIISGGDPLTMSDEKLEYILKTLRSIEHIEVLRIGTKVPMVMPMRITPALCSMLKKYHPLFISIHCTLPEELTPEAKRACAALADSGIPLGSQTVLLEGVNNDAAVMKSLMQKIIESAVKRVKSEDNG